MVGEICPAEWAQSLYLTISIQNIASNCCRLSVVVSKSAVRMPVGCRKSCRIICPAKDIAIRVMRGIKANKSLNNDKK